jgi:hypothetical protein
MKERYKKRCFQSASDFQDGPLLFIHLFTLTYYFGYFVLDGGGLVYMTGNKSNSRFPKMSKHMLD